MIGVKELIKSYCPKIDWDKKAKEKSKALGISKDQLLKEWEEARDKGLNKGKILHDSKSKDYINEPSYIKYKYDHNGGDVPDIDCIVKEGFIYDEKMFVHPKYPLKGIPDRIKVNKGKIYIEDFKSDKAIYKVAKMFKNGKFFTKQKMLPPIGHLDYCNYIEYVLQLSLYMRLVMDNNKTLRFGGLSILHTKFDEDTLEPLSEEVIEVPYLRKEVEALLKTLKK